MDTATHPADLVRGPAGQYVPYSPELDDLTLPEKPEASAAGPKAAERFIDLYSWWKKTGPETTPFVVVEKELEWTLKGPRTAYLWILLVGDSNRHRRSLNEFIKAVEAGLIENITYR
ncbi:hypothetical protein GO755_04945 [Spirosoma sp. HMF4905]|uniref:Uncharacterized protein n=1 Tax=Spirosoma arboris TaxID=2682092 RepID=A0A7K1S6B9_9BACT|nr:hypothetical protein [Spirosoma arboris]MVM29371.1 hypothetical protein [Spirosoma arboris]